MLAVGRDRSAEDIFDRRVKGLKMVLGRVDHGRFMGLKQACGKYTIRVIIFLD